MESVDVKRENQLMTLFNTLKDNPVPFKAYDVSKLEGYNDVYRVRLGELRVVYKVEWSERLISVIYIGPKGKAYDRRY